MKKIAIILIFHFTLISINAQSNFLSNQKKYINVKTALDEKEEAIIKSLEEKKINLSELNILILVFKAESELEVYIKKQTELKYKAFKTFKICLKSGELGPKREKGDYQVPEGFYHINRFNPLSSFYLSLGINYPNLSDRKKSNASNLGGDIFIHGSCVTIGCIPMTDDKIKEIYIYAINAKNNGQNKIPVYIFPYRMTTKNFNFHKKKYKNKIDLLNFWTNIKLGYEKFNKNKQELKISIGNKGNYNFDD